MRSRNDASATVANVDTKFAALIEEARASASGRLYLNKAGHASVVTDKPPFHDADTVKAAVDAGLFTHSLTAGRHGGVYLTEKGRSADFAGAASPADKAGEGAPTTNA